MCTALVGPIRHLQKITKAIINTEWLTCPLHPTSSSTWVFAAFTRKERSCFLTVAVCFTLFSTHLADDKFKRVVAGSVYLRYPEKDQKKMEFPGACPLFTFPRGIELSFARLSAQNHQYVITEVSGARLYGYCRTIYLPAPAEAVERLRSRVDAAMRDTLDSHSTGLYLPFAITILSYFPFHTKFKHLLTSLCGTIDTVPELQARCRSISQLFMVPMVGPGEEISFTADMLRAADIPLTRDVSLTFAVPPMADLPICDTTLSALCSALEPRLVVDLLNMLVMERKIVVVASSPEQLVLALEELLALLHPMEWPYIYIPLLPITLTDVLYAPMPFIVGVIRNALPLVEIPPDAVSVDLDEHTVIPPSPEALTDDEVRRSGLPTRHYLRLCKAFKVHANVFHPLNPNVPDKTPTRVTIDGNVFDGPTLESLYDSDFERSDDEDEAEEQAGPAFGYMLPSIDTEQVRWATLGVFSSLLEKFWQFVQFSGDAAQIFDNEGFLGSAKVDTGSFLSGFVQTQIFQCFIQSRIAQQVSVKDAFETTLFTNLVRRQAIRDKLADQPISGQLYKQGRRVRSWRLRNFTLEKCTLIYYKPDNGDGPGLEKGSLDLVPGRSRVFIPPLDAGTPTRFHFTVEVEATRVLRLCASSGQERRRWIRALHSRVGELDAVLFTTDTGSSGAGPSAQAVKSISRAHKEKLKRLNTFADELVVGKMAAYRTSDNVSFGFEQLDDE